MKKLFTIVALAILVGLSAFAIDWTSDKVENLASGAEVTVSSIGENSDPKTIIDGNVETRWIAGGVKVDDKRVHDWALLDLKESKTFTSMQIRWSNAHCTEYSVYVTDEKPEVLESMMDETYKEISGNWLENHDATTVRETNTDDFYYDNIEFENEVTGRYVLIYANAYNGLGETYGAGICELRIANVANRDDVSELKLTQEGNAVAGGDAVTVKVAAYNNLGEEVELSKLSDLQLTCDNEKVTVVNNGDGTFSVTASEQGEYTLVATATATENKGDQVLRAEMTLNVAYNWEAVENIATGKQAYARVGIEVDHTADKAVDGDDKTYYYYNNNKEGVNPWTETWTIVDLGDEYMVDAIGAKYVGAQVPGGNKNSEVGGTFKIGYATNAAKVLDRINNDGDFAWNNLSEDEKADWTMSSTIDRNSNTTTQVYDKPVVARYIVICDGSNPHGNPMLAEIYVKGVKRDVPVASSIEVSADGNYVVTDTKVTLSAEVKDQYGAKMEGQEVTFSCTDKNATLTGNVFSASAVGEYTVTATCGELAPQPFVVYVSADAANKYGANADVESVNNTVTVGGESNTNDSFRGQQIVVAENTLPTTIEYTFAKPYSFSMLNLRWEAACPSSYKMKVTYENGDSQEIQVVENRPWSGYNESDKVVNAAAGTLNGVASVNLENVTKLALTIEAKAYAANDWGIKLFGIDAYGVEAPAQAVDIHVDFPAAYEYGTLILPFDAVPAATMQLFKVNSYTSNEGEYTVLNLQEVDGTKIVANTPYIVKTPTAGFDFKGVPSNDKDAYTEGWLTGVLKETQAPQGSYVLQSQDGKLAFYKVTSDDIKVPANRAYISTTQVQGVKALVFDLDGITGIEEFATSNTLVNVYDLNGVLVRKAVKACDSLKGLQNGVYVVNGAKKVVK